VTNNLGVKTVPSLWIAGMALAPYSIGEENLWAGPLTAHSRLVS